MGLKEKTSPLLFLGPIGLRNRHYLFNPLLWMLVQWITDMCIFTNKTDYIYIYIYMYIYIHVYIYIFFFLGGGGSKMHFKPSLSRYLWLNITMKKNPSDSWFIITQQSMRENEYGNSGHLSIFTSFHLIMLLKCKLFRASFSHIIKETNSM